MIFTQPSANSFHVEFDEIDIYDKFGNINMCKKLIGPRKDYTSDDDEEMDSSCSAKKQFLHALTIFVELH